MERGLHILIRSKQKENGGENGGCKISYHFFPLFPRLTQPHNVFSCAPLSPLSVWVQFFFFFWLFKLNYFKK